MTIEPPGEIKDMGDGRYSFPFVLDCWPGGREQFQVYVDVYSDGRKTYSMQGGWDHCDSPVEDLDIISQRVKKETLLSEGAGKAKITVHMGTCGIAAGAQKIMDVLSDEFKKQDLKDVILTNSGCAGLCMVIIVLNDSLSNRHQKHHRLQNEKPHANCH